MEDSFQQVLYGVIAILFWLGPRILKWIGNRRTTPRVPAVAADSRPSVTSRPRVELSEQPTKTGQVENLAERTRRLVVGCDVMLAEARDRADSPFAHGLTTHCKDPAVSLLARLESRQNLDTMTGQGVSGLSAQIVALERRAKLMAHIHSQRTAYDDIRVLRALDAAASDCAGPLLIHAHRRGLSTGTGLDLVVPASGSSGSLRRKYQTDIGVLEVPEDILDSPALWSETAAACGMAFYNGSSSLRRTMAAELGFPDASQAMSYFMNSGRLTLVGLASSWLPWVFADCVATLQLGSAHLAGMDARARMMGPLEAVTARLDDKGHVLSIPMMLRGWVSASVLQRMGPVGRDAEERWQSMLGHLGEPTQLLLVTDRFPPVHLPAGDLLSVVAGAVEGLMDRPLTGLGGYPLSLVPELAMDEARYDRVAEGVLRLRAGRATRVAPVEILASAVLAAQKAPHFQAQIKAAAMASLIGKGRFGRVVERSSNEMIGRQGDDRSLAQLARDPEFLVGAMVVSSVFSRLRGGRQSGGAWG